MVNQEKVFGFGSQFLHWMYFKRKMKVHIVFLFITGFSIGIILQIRRTEPFRDWEGGLRTTESENEKTTLGKNRVLCFVPTTVKYLHEKTVHVKQTWGKFCDKTIFTSNVTDLNLNLIGLNVSDNHDQLWDKVKQTLNYIHRNFIDDFDWFALFDPIFA